MSMSYRLLWRLPLCVFIGVVIAGCERSARDAGGPPSFADASAKAELPAGLFLEQAPGNAKDVGELKGDSDTAGDVVVHGRIGGRRDPFVAGRAMFMLADLEMPTCDERHEDECPTPWDYCCEPKDKLLASTATVQVVGADGRPLAIGLNGRNGLKPQARVVVSGRVSKRDADNVLVIDATGIFVQKG